MYKYNDGLESGGRHPRLYLVKNGKVEKFVGQNISDFCAVAAEQYKKNGKWSNTTYSLELAPGVRPLYFISPLHGVWGDNFTSWGEVMESLGLSIEVVQGLIRAEYPTAAERFDKLDEFTLAIEVAGVTTEIVIISFGSPTNRAISEGYWESPKSSKTSDGQAVTIAPFRGDGDNDWYHPVVIEPEGSSILSAKHSPGMHGGYWAIEVIVPMKMS